MTEVSERPKPGQRLSVQIDRLSVGGRGVARHEGLVIFVPDTAPDESVEIELEKVRKNFAEGRLIRVLRASPHRRVAPCPVAGICGGCSWQHVEYEEQLRQKHQLVSEALRRMSGFGIGPETVSAVVPSPDEFRYRNRIQLQHEPREGGARMGFFKRGSNQIVAIDDCPITEASLTKEFPRFRKDFASQPRGRHEMYLDTSNHVRIRAAAPSRGDEDAVSEVAGPAFSQVNSGQNANLVSFVAAIARVSRAMEIFDLYAGSGNFSFPLARELSKTRITAVELNPESVRYAQETIAKDFPHQGIDFKQADVGDFLQDTQLPRNSIVILDPPRSGCDPRVMTELAQQAPVDILYVSCHPVTLARDLRYLHDADYELVRVQPFDMFPQTDHVETVVHLRRPRPTS